MQYHNPKPYEVKYKLWEIIIGGIVGIILCIIGVIGVPLLLLLAQIFRLIERTKK